MDLSISLYPYLSNTMKCTYCNQFARYHPYYYCCFRGCVCRVHVHLNFSCYSYLAPTYQNPTHTSRRNHFPDVPSDALVLAKCKSLNCYSSKYWTIWCAGSFCNLLDESFCIKTLVDKVTC